MIYILNCGTIPLKRKNYKIFLKFIYISARPTIVISFTQFFNKRLRAWFKIFIFYLVTILTIWCLFNKKPEKTRTNVKK